MPTSKLGEFTQPTYEKWEIFPNKNHANCRKNRVTVGETTVYRGKGFFGMAPAGLEIVPGRSTLTGDGNVHTHMKGGVNMTEKEFIEVHKRVQRAILDVRNKEAQRIRDKSDTLQLYKRQAKLAVEEVTRAIRQREITENCLNVELGMQAELINDKFQPHFDTATKIRTRTMRHADTMSSALVDTVNADKVYRYAVTQMWENVRNIEEHYNAEVE